MKKLIFILLFICTGLIAQNYQVDYYNAGKPGSKNLLIADSDSVTSEYWLMGQISMLQVDSNWTASNIAFEIWNPYTNDWELLYYKDGTLVEYIIIKGTTLGTVPAEVAGIQRVRFKKVNNGATVTQSGAASSIIVHTILY